MEALKSPNSARPGSLSSPVPGDDMAAAAKAFMANQAPAALPSPAQGQPAAPQDDMAQAAQQFASGPTDDQFAPEPGFAEANKDQFSNFVTRLQTGLAANDTEKLNFLKKKFGPDNAVVRDDKIYFRKPGEKFKRLDPATLEVVNDLIPDFAREMVTEVGMVPGEVAGGLAGAGAGGVGAVPGAVMGRAASVPFANALADKVSELAGVPQDEARKRGVENGIGMAAEAVLPIIGNKLLSKIPGTTAGVEAYNAAKEAGQREIVALSKQSQKVAEAVHSLAQEGRAATVDGAIAGLPGTQINLMGHQLNPDNPILQNFANKAASDPRFINAQQQLAQDWGASAESTLKEIGRLGNPGPYKPEVLAKTVTNAVDDLQKAEGMAIGKFRAQAMANLKNEKQPLAPETTQKITDMMKEFGFRFRTNADGSGLTAVPPNDIGSLVGKMGLTSTGEVRSVVNNLNELGKGVKKGLTVTDIDRLRNSIGSTSDNLFRTQAGAKLGALSGDLRQLYRDTISKGLPEDFDKAAFNSAMDDFSQLKMNVGTLKNALMEDSSAQAIVKNIFTGKENLQKVQAIKKISPESFAALKETFVNQLLTEYSSRENATGLKSSQFLDAINKKYGDQFLHEVFDGGKGPGLDTVKKILTVTERIEQQTKRSTVDNMSEQQKKGIVDAATGLFFDIKFKTINGVNAVLRGTSSGDNILTQILTRDGVDKYVANYPGRAIDKKLVHDQLNQYLAESKFYGAARREGAKLQRPVKAAAKQQLQELAPE